MDVKSFVAESLEQIIAGIREAQAKAGGEFIAAEQFGSVTGNLMHGGTSGVFTAVDFDLAVTASTTGSGKAQVSVFGIELGGGGQHEIGRESRLKFTVPVKLPLGGRVPRSDSSSQRAPRYDPLDND